MGFKTFLAEEAKKDKPKEYSEAELRERQKKKTQAINKLAKNLSSLKAQVSKDLSSSDEKTQLTALAVALINDTKERIGNDRSANGIRKDEDGKDVKGDPHFGVTGWMKKHIKINNGTATIKYVGKSGVDQEKKVSDSKIVSTLKKFMDSDNESIFTTSEGTKIVAKHVNEYLDKYEVSAKDLRGFGANELIIKELNAVNAPADEKERKKLFLDIAQKVADMLGHSPTMLRNSYLLPDLEEMYLKSGRVKKI